MGDVLKPSMMHDSINTLQNNFVDLGINKEPTTVSFFTKFIKSTNLFAHLYFGEFISFSHIKSFLLPYRYLCIITY